MGLGMKFFNPANFRNMAMIARLSNSLDKHMNKRCAYCGLDMGIGDEFPVVEFVEHLASQHQDKIAQEDIEGYNKLIKRMMR